MIGAIGCFVFVSYIFIVMPLKAWLVDLPASVADRELR